MLINTVCRTEKTIASELDGEVVMMSIELGEYYGLGQIGSHIWRIIEQPITVQQIIDKCIAQYEVDFEQCQQDVLPFLAQLHLKGLISCL